MVTVGANGQPGMYGSELAELMGQLGAYFALNVDGGGSSHQAGGYKIIPRSYRTVANHLGVYAGSSRECRHVPVTVKVLRYAK